MSRHGNTAGPVKSPGRTDKEQLPVELRTRLIMHGEMTPYHRRLQRDQNIDYADLRTWTDLRETFGYLDDEALRALDPDELVPEHHTSEELVVSRSSGTTGTVKEIYWHEADLQDNIANIVQYLEPLGVPEGVHWVVTSTPNPVLEQSLQGVAAHFDGTIDVIRVNPTPVKRALQSGDPDRIDATFTPIATEVQAAFDRDDVRVYSDIAPLMQYVGSHLQPKVRNQIQLLLVGGVGTDRETITTLTEELFPNAQLSGWYGDYMLGSCMMHQPGTLEYHPPAPDIHLEVRDRETIDNLVPVGEAGELVGHGIRRGFFIPNRRIGDQATRISIDGVEGITTVGRLPEIR